MESHVGPSADKKTALFQAIEEKFPSRSLGDDRWYLVAVALCLASDFRAALN